MTEKLVSKKIMPQKSYRKKNHAKKVVKGNDMVKKKFDKYL